MFRVLCPCGTGRDPDDRKREWGRLCALARGHFSKWLNPLPTPAYQDSTTDCLRAHSSSSGHKSIVPGVVAEPLPLLDGVLCR